MNVLRKTRIDRGWSQARMISELRRQAQVLGESIPEHGSLKTMLSRWENAHAVPAPVYRRLLSAALDLPPSALGLPAPEDHPQDVRLGLAPASTTWAEDAQIASELWSGDMDRRGILQHAAFSAAALALPATTALLPTQRQTPASTQGVLTAGPGDVDCIRTITKSLRSIDNRYGGGQARSTAVNYLSNSVAPLLTKARFSRATGKELFTAAAELTQLVGWMSFDVGKPGLGQRHLIQAHNLASHAGDDALVAEILAALSHQASNLHAYDEAIALAQAAGVLARRRRIFALTAEAEVMEAHGHAGRGDIRACLRSISKAEVALDQDRGNDPEWIGYFDEAYLAAKFGHCFKALGDSTATVRYASRSLRMNGTYARGRVFNLTLLAHGHAAAGDIDQACAVGLQAIDGASNLKSERAKAYLRDLRKTLPSARQSTAVQSFDQALRPVLAA